MRIRSFHIDGFGVFSDVNVERLSPGLSIFLGDNEAGKSTCLEFFRAMLTGYPDPRSKEAKERNFAPLRGGQAGGSLGVETHKHGLVRLTRRPGNGGGFVTLTDAQGNALDMGVLDQLLAGVTREVYRSVFGFSLTELQNFDSLNSEGVRHALYGASFGMGLRPPGQVLKVLEEQMEHLFKGSGSKPPLNAALQEWKNLQQELAAAQAECLRFDDLTLERDNTAAKLAALRENRQIAERRRREVERQLGVWKQWDEWRTARSRLERLEEVPDTFPQDGPQRLERATQAHMECARKAQLQEERCQRVREQLEGIVVDESVLAFLPRLQALAERKGSFRSAYNALPSHRGALQRARAELARLLTGLGPDWTCERIRGTDRSLFAREGMERQAAEMQAAEAAHVAATAALEKANKGVDSAEQSHALALAALEHLPIPDAELDEAGRETLRRTLAQLEDARRLLPEKTQAMRTAQGTFARSFSLLRLRSGVAPEQALDALTESQDKAMQLAATAQHTLADAQEAAQAVAQAQDAEENAKGRVDRLRAQQRIHQGPSRAALDTRAAALRSLRHLHNTLSVEQDRQREADSRLQAMQAPAPLKSLPLIFIGLLLMLTGAAMLLARWQLGMTSFALTPQLIVPITLWSGYLVVLTGVGFLAGGIPRSGPEAQRHAIETEQLRTRSENSRLRLTELEAQIQEQCVLAEVTNGDPVTLDATELLLEREREQCVTDERLNLEMTTLEAERAALHERTRLAQQRAAQADAVVQQARKRWHEFLQGCHVGDVPAAEAATAFFARVDAARVAWSGAAALEVEVRALETHMRDMEEAARAVPPVARMLADAPDSADALDAVMDAMRRTLEACREADAAAEERLKAAAAAHNAELNLERASMTQGEAADALHRSEDTLGAAREAWSSMLEDLGLGLELSPGTVREALECMERCLAAEAEVARLEDEQRRLERERDALILPLREIEEGLGRQTPSPDDDVDWGARLDALLAAAQNMHNAQREKGLQAVRLEESQDELAAAQRALADADAEVCSLLDMAHADTPEAFLRLAFVQGQRRELRQRMEDLEDALRLAADDRPLDEFLATFADADQREREAQVAALTENIVAMNEEEQRLATQQASLSASLQQLATADRLSTLRQQEAELYESIRHMGHEWSRHALARQLLLQAKQRFERERQPQVIRTASDIFAAVTDRRWAGLTASLEDSALSVLPPHGEPLSPAQLSRGAQEQIYLAMRLAYIRNHAAHASALPVIMDDILVNFDPSRALRTAAALLDLTRGPQGREGEGHQVLFFTCHPHLADMLQEIMPSSSRFLVDDGSVRHV